MYDFIGDVHGHADELEELFGKLGYARRGENYSQPDRQAVFVGDLIDRGPKNREVLQIVRGMVDSGAALAVMGNHEYNAICYHTPDATGGHLREHNDKHQTQHQATLDAFAGQDGELQDTIAWFKTLPLFLELDGCRVVHACWNDDEIARVRQVGPGLDEGFLRASSDKSRGEYATVEELLKGPEIPLPGDQFFLDKDGHKRTLVRIRWWDDPAGKTYGEFGLVDGVQVPTPLPESIVSARAAYPADAPPVFFGHYWFTGPPTLQTANACCLDCSVAKGGHLVAYRWNGERTLDPQNFEAVPARSSGLWR